MTIRVVIADDHPLILNALEGLFKSQGDFAMTARCATGEEALQAVRRHRPDVLILDLRMRGMDGLAVIRAMNEAELETRVVLLTAELDESEALEAIRLGVKGVVLKEMAPRLLLQCVRTVSAGGQWLERTSTAHALKTMLDRENASQTVLKAGLTPRELEIVRAVATGLRNREIAERLNISEGTIKVHLHNIYEKLNVDSRVALTLYAHERRLL
jgi:DNA-binding NarL/FixJ family response regulator